MYRLINANTADVIDALRRIGDLDSYRQLRVELVSNPVSATTPEFQRSYRRYWSMNAARLPTAFYERYFALLRTCTEQGRVELEQVTRTICDVDGANYGLQFSFATKLVHMVDPTVPVFDSFVAAFYFFTPPTSGGPFDERLAKLLGFHRFLEREYARVLQMGLLRPSIDQLRRQEQLDSTVPDERIIDWLIWGWVELLRRGAQLRGTAQYD